METLLINTIISILIAIIPYLVKYKKKYNLIAGYSDYKKNDPTTNHSLEKKAILISNYIFLFCTLIIIFSVFNYFFLFKIHKSNALNDLTGLYIIIFSAITSIIIYIIHKQLKIK